MHAHELSLHLHPPQVLIPNHPPSSGNPGATVSIHPPPSWVSLTQHRCCSHRAGHRWSPPGNRSSLWESEVTKEACQRVDTVGRVPFAHPWTHLCGPWAPPRGCSRGAPSCSFYFFFNNFYWSIVALVVLASTVQQNDSATHTCIHTHCHVHSPYMRGVPFGLLSHSGHHSA